MLDMFLAAGFRVESGLTRMSEPLTSKKIEEAISSMATAVGVDPKAALQDCLPSMFVVKLVPADADLQAARIQPAAAGQGAFSWRDIPVFIINRDRCSTLKRLQEWLTGIGLRRIAIVDNDSTYPPLLDYYRSLQDASGVRVIFLGQNRGPYSPWNLGLLDGVDTPYIVTDSDLVPADDCPADLIERMLDLVIRHPEYHKVGVGLRLDNLPACYAQHEVVRKWESQFWHCPAGEGVFVAAVDTTFAMYPAGGQFSMGPQSLRMGYPCLFEHRPWYVDEASLDEEEAYYRSHAAAKFANWSVDNKTSWMVQTARMKTYEASGRILHLGGGDEHIPGWVNADRSGRLLEVALGRDWTGPALPFPEHSFDGIYMPRPLEGRGMDADLMAELMRIAKPGARCFFRVPGGAGRKDASETFAGTCDLLTRLVELSLVQPPPGAARHWEGLRMAVVMTGDWQPTGQMETVPDFFRTHWTSLIQVAVTLVAAEHEVGWQSPPRFPGELTLSRDILVCPDF